MQPTVFRSLRLNSQDQTDRFASALAPLLRAGDTILLSGGLGAGKTHFARRIIQTRLAAANLFEDVPSPTFTLVQTYDDGTVEIWHSDLYRLGSSDEVIELGLEEAFTNAISLVEWPDRLDDLTPGNALHLSFAMTETPGERQVDAASSSDRWQALLNAALHGISDDR